MGGGGGGIEGDLIWLLPISGAFFILFDYRYNLYTI